MNIIVPINVEVLRVSSSTKQQAKMALYDFSELGGSPVAGGNNLVAAKRFGGAQYNLSEQPGIHLHWSLPKAYTQGRQEKNSSSIQFRTLPNRWLVTRFFKDIANDPISVKYWILESDAHDKDQTVVGDSGTAIPWRDETGNLLYNMKFHYAGNVVPLNDSWQEPSTDKGYLGSKLQAPFGYGETFTAYYQNCGSIFGLYDTLDDAFAEFQNKQAKDQTFSISYVVSGWVSPQSNDTCLQILNTAVASYQDLPADNKPEFTDYISQVFETELKWTLDDYSSFTIDNAGQTQAVLCGTVAGIKWDTVEGKENTYPSALPSTDDISISIGNTASEAVSAYLASIEKINSTPDPGDITSNIEWLLNALQSGRMSYLGTGEMGVGQLEEYLHTRTFGSKAGGYIWSVRNKMTPGSTAISKANAEVALSLPLAKVLARLNDSQHSYDKISEEILTRQQKIFFDWNYHITAIENNVINSENGDIDDDNSQNYLLDGIMNLFPRLVEAGSSGKLTGAAPYNYTPLSFSICVPDSEGMYATGFSAYVFNGTANANAATVAIQLLDACYQLEGAIPEGLDSLQQQIRSAILFLTASKAGGNDAAASLQKAILAVQAAQNIAQTLAGSYTGLFQSSSGLNDIKTNKVDTALAALSALSDPSTSVFAQCLGVDSSCTVPMAAGQVYTGQMISDGYDNAGYWDKNGNFQGIKDLLDQLTGQGNYQPSLFDTQSAGIYLAGAYFWRMSQQNATSVVPYYVQMTQHCITEAKTAAQTTSTALGNALNASSNDAIVNATGLSLSAIASTIIPAILSDLNNNNRDIKGDISKLQTLLNGTSQQPNSLSIAQLSANMQSDSWKTLVTQVEAAFQQVLQCLPFAQQVSILSNYLFNSIKGKFELASIPADPYWSPTEPVMLMAGTSDDSDLLKPINRNGKADVLPCRLDTELVTSNTSVYIPTDLSNLSGKLSPSIPALNTLLQQLATEGLMLWPEFNTSNSSALLTAWQNNITAQGDQVHGVTLSDAPTGFTGKLPYYTAYNRQADGDTFQPLFIYWKAEYVHSNKIDFTTEQLPADFLNGFSVDRYGADYQPLAASANDFNIDRTGPDPNFFTISGVIPLSSASTANLCDEICRYSQNNINYDPSQGPPDPNSTNAALEEVFYSAWAQFKTSNFLSQRLSGLNAGMIQRTQELQIPVNIPKGWLKDIDEGSLWPSQFLFDQSKNWPSAWVSEAIDDNVLQQSKSSIYFSPLRAGFLQMSEIWLVDTFGRFVQLPANTPTAIAENLQCQTNVSLADHPVYLPPRLIQPSRLLAKWLSAESPLIGEFTDWNPQPASSPVCGWLLPNHLDDSLMVYSNAGVPIGSMRNTSNFFRWFTVPGEAYQEGDNRLLMLNDIGAKNDNLAFSSFLGNFIYPSSTSDAANNFTKFLDVIEKSREFLVTKSLQENQSLAVLIGQPLVVVRMSLKLEMRGLPFTSLDQTTYPPWDGNSPQFRFDDDSFIPYNFDNFNDGGIKQLQVPVSIGAIDYQKNDQPVVFFDDGLVGFFVNDDYTNCYTPVNTNSEYMIKSTYQSTTQPVSLVPAGDSVTITMIMDPCASVHISSSILPVNQISLPPDQYASTLNKIMVTFLTAPILRTSNGVKIPVPSETGYNWSWWQVGAADDTPVRPSQANTDAFFTGNPQMIIDGWLKLKKNEAN